MARGPKPYYAREPRSDLRLPVRLFFDGGERSGQLANVSLSGGFIELDEPPGERLVLALTVSPPVGDPLYFHAMVIRAATDGAERPGCAVQFLNLSPESEGRLAYLIKKKATPRPQR